MRRLVHRRVVRRRTALAALAAVAVLAGGCGSQIDALGPVGGDTAFSVRTAAIDILLANDLAVGRAPECAGDGTQVTCAGTLADGTAVTVTAPGKKPTTLTVTVGDDVLYDGSIQAVLDEAARDTGGAS